MALIINGWLSQFSRKSENSKIDFGKKEMLDLGVDQVDFAYKPIPSLKFCLKLRKILIKIPNTDFRNTFGLPAIQLNTSRCSGVFISKGELPHTSFFLQKAHYTGWMPLFLVIIPSQNSSWWSRLKLLRFLAMEFFKKRWLQNFTD